MFPSTLCGYHATITLNYSLFVFYNVVGEYGCLKSSRQPFAKPSVLSKLDNVACLIALCYY